MRIILCFIFLVSFLACNNQQSSVASAGDSKTAAKAEKDANSNKSATKSNQKNPIRKQAKIDRESAVVYQVLYCLRNNNYNEYDRLLVNKDQFLDYFRQVSEFDESQANNQTMVDAAYTFFKDAGLKNFERMSNKCKSSNINWDAAEVKSSNLKDNVLNVIFSDGTQKFNLTVNNCINLDGTFFIGNNNFIE